MHPSDVLASGMVVPRRFRLGEYHRLIDIGVLGEDERVELLEGFIVEEPPPSRAHALIVTRLNRLLIRSLSDFYRVRPQLPLSLGEDSEPEPDLAVVTLQQEETAKVHPRAALLVVEVSGEDSLRKDRVLKGRIYAQAQVPEYWLVDVEHHAVEVYTEPDAQAGRYRSLSTLGAGELLRASVLPEVSLPVADLFS